MNLNSYCKIIVKESNFRNISRLKLDGIYKIKASLLKRGGVLGFFVYMASTIVLAMYRGEAPDFFKKVVLNLIYSVL